MELYKDKDWLYEQYYIQKHNKREIAKLANCNEMTIHKYMKQFGFQTDNTLSRKRKYNYNESYFDNIDTPEKAYWLGYIAADGCIRKVRNNKTNTSENRLKFCISIQDKDHLCIFRDSICPELKIKDHITYLKATNKYYQGCSLTVYNTHIVNSLLALGIEQNKSTKEKMPLLKKEFQRAFILGYFDGDGCFSYWSSALNGLQYEVTIVGSETIVNQIGDIIKEAIGLEKHIRQDGKIYTLVYTLNNATQLMEWLYKENIPFLQRKFNKYKEYLQLKEGDEIGKKMD